MEWDAGGIEERLDLRALRGADDGQRDRHRAEDLDRDPGAARLEVLVREERELIGAGWACVGRPEHADEQPAAGERRQGVMRVLRVRPIPHVDPVLGEAGH